MDQIACPECESTEINSVEDTPLETLTDHAKDVKCMSCGVRFSIEYTATALSVYTSEDDSWEMYDLTTA